MNIVELATFTQADRVINHLTMRQGRVRSASEIQSGFGCSFSEIIVPRFLAAFLCTATGSRPSWGPLV
jgi:hypothetical protein